MRKSYTAAEFALVAQPSIRSLLTGLYRSANVGWNLAVFSAELTLSSDLSGIQSRDAPYRFLYAQNMASFTNQMHIITYQMPRVKIKNAQKIMRSLAVWFSRYAVVGYRHAD